MGGGEAEKKKDPVVLATGSFDANCGLWVWNRGHDNDTENDGLREASSNVPGGFNNDEEAEIEQDFTNQADGDNEEWHFSTLLTGPDSEIKDLEFSPPHYGANLLATSSRDKSVWVWEEVEPEEWETVAVLSEHAGDVKCVGWLSGAVTSRGEIRGRIARRKRKEQGAGGMEVDGSVNGQQEDDDEEIILGGRELLASGAYDDTIRLHHDDEAEGDWMSIAVLTGHDGTVWDLKFESHVNLAPYPLDTSVDEVIADWAPRLLSCSDDMTVRVWKKDLNEKEKDERRMRIADAKRGQNVGGAGTESAGGGLQTGFSSSRLPSVIRPPTSTERWSEESKLPAVHVRSIYAVDWSSKTGLVVSCGGDGLIAVYREVAVPSQQKEDVVMNGTNDPDHQEEAGTEEDIAKVKTEWKVVAMMEAAHDEYEVNHVCWSARRDVKRGQIDDEGSIEDGEEEYIVSTGDDGDVKIWSLPQELLQEVMSD